MAAAHAADAPEKLSIAGPRVAKGGRVTLPAASDDNHRHQRRQDYGGVESLWTSLRLWHISSVRKCGHPPAARGKSTQFFHRPWRGTDCSETTGDSGRSR